MAGVADKTALFNAGDVETVLKKKEAAIDAAYDHLKLAFKAFDKNGDGFLDVKSQRSLTQRRPSRFAKCPLG